MNMGSNLISRRGFLKGSGSLLGLAMLNSFAFAEQAAASEGDFAFAIVADSHIDPYVPKYSDNLGKIFTELASEASRPSFVLHLGDVVECGFPEEYQEYRRLVPAALQGKVHAVPGNHETRWDEWAKEWYTQLFGASYYSFDFGGIHFVALDPTQLLQEGGYLSPEQLNWLENDLKAAGKRVPIILYLHYPIGADHYYISNVDALFRIIEPYNVRACFSGHVHREQIWKQNGMTVFSLPATKTVPAYLWVEKKNEPLIGAVLSVYHAEFINGAVSEKKLIAEVALDGEAPAQHEKPQYVKWQEQAGEGPASELRVGLGPKSKATSVACQWWPDAVYAGGTGGAWQNLTPTEAGATSKWSAEIATGDMTSGRRRLMVRVTGESGAFWDEHIDIDLSVGSTPATSIFTLEWEREASSPVQAGLAALDDSVPLVAVAQTNGSVTAVNLSRKGRTEWEFKAKGPVIGTPAVSPDRTRLCFGSADHRVYALDAKSGTVLWTYAGAEPVLSSPIWFAGADGQEIVLVAIGKTLFKLDGRTGAVMWSAGLNGFFAGKPATDGKAVYAAAGNGTVKAFDMQSGGLLWQKTLATKDRPYSTLIYSPWYTIPYLTTGAMGRELVLFSSVTECTALDRSTGAVVWKKKGGYMYAEPAGVTSTASLLMVDEWGVVTAIDPTNGATRWSVKTKQRIFNASPVEYDGRVYVTGVNGLLTVIDTAEGKIAQEYRFSVNYAFSTPVIREGMIVTAGHDGNIRALRIQN